MENLAVRFEGDGAPDTANNIINALSNTETATLENNFKLNTYPNPTVNSLNIEFANNLSDSTTLIDLYDSNGEKVVAVFNGYLGKEEIKTIAIDFTSIVNGNYFLLVESNGEKLVRQIIKQ